MRGSSNCVEHAEKENFHFPIEPHTFLRLGCPAPKCTITQKQLICRGFKCGFRIPRAKTLHVPIFKVLASLEVILCTKNVIF